MMCRQRLEGTIRTGVVLQTLLLRASPLPEEMMMQFLDGKSRAEMQKDDGYAGDELRSIPHIDDRGVNGAGWTQEDVRLLHFSQSTPNFPII